MSAILFFIIFFTCIGVGKIFLQINSVAVAFNDILIAAWEGLKVDSLFFHEVFLSVLYSNENCWEPHCQIADFLA